MPDIYSNIYITTPGTSIGCSGERFIIKRDKKILSEIPAMQIRQIVIFGNSSLTSQAVYLVLKKGISVCYLSGSGKFRGKLEPEPRADGSIREQQTLCRLSERTRLEICREIIKSKMRNSLLFCMRKRKPHFKKTIVTMKEQLNRVDAAETLNSLRGHEGAFAKLYFKNLKSMMKDDLGFSGRKSRNCDDGLNIMLNIAYSLLYNNIRTAVNIAGLDPYQGFLHSNDFGHAALASDLMESFRSIISDSIVLTAINRSEVSRKDFVKTKNGLTLSNKAFRKIMEIHDRRMNTKVFDYRVGMKIDYYKIFENQARNLVHVIKKDIDRFQPFIVRG